MEARMNQFSVLRANAGISIEELADQTGFSASTLYRWERGECEARKAVIHVLETLGQFADRGTPLTSSFRFIDLFAGIGGLRIPFEEIGGKCVFTSEWDRFARQTYSANFHDDPFEHTLEGDIRPFAKDPEQVPEHDVLLAGFPCQPFSIAGVSKKNSLGRPHGFLCDTQGTLFYDLAKIIEYHKPKAFLLENVKNLESHDGGQTFATIMNVLENELGYDVHFEVINSEHWVPQRRQRIFIVGFSTPQPFDFEALDMPGDEGPKLGSILDDEVPEKYTLTERLWEYLQAYRKKHQRAGNGFGFSLFGPDDVARTLSARYYKDGSEILIAQSGKRPRRLTPRECARLMGFEKPGKTDFKIPVSDTQAYRQFGNAVVVPVVQAVADLMSPFVATPLESETRRAPAIEGAVVG